MCEEGHHNARQSGSSNDSTVAYHHGTEVKEERKLRSGFPLLNTGTAMTVFWRRIDAKTVNSMTKVSKKFDCLRVLV